MSNRHAKVWSVLRQCKGKENAITARKLSSMTGISEREVRSIVAQLRRGKGNKPIASTTSKPYGFFVPASKVEARACQAQLYSRMREIGMTARALDHAFGEHLPSRQMVLDLFNSDGV